MSTFIRAAARGAVSCTALLALAGLPSIAGAQVLANEEFSSDADTFTPNTRNPQSESDFGVSVPSSWNDGRTGWLGVIEEANAASNANYAPIDAAGANSPGYAIVQHEQGLGPYWVPGSNLTGTSVVFSVDHYADPLITSNGAGPDFLWSNSVLNTGGNYITEAGISADAGAGTYAYRTAGGLPIRTVPSGAWYELETILTPGLDGTFDAMHNLWDAGHTSLLGSAMVISPPLNPVNQPMGARYSWFTNFSSNVDVIFVDDFNVAIVPEPTGVGLLAAAGISLLTRGRRHRA